MIAGLIGGALSVLLAAVLLRTVRQTARQVASRQILEYGLPLRALGVVMLLIGILFLYAASCVPADVRSIAWPVCGFAGAAAFSVFLEFFFVRIEFDDQFIYTTSPW